MFRSAVADCSGGIRAIEGCGQLERQFLSNRKPVAPLVPRTNGVDINSVASGNRLKCISLSDGVYEVFWPGRLR